MFGDCLKANLDLLKNSNPKAKKGDNAFWVILLKSAVQDIISIYPEDIHSDFAIKTYYTILKNNEDYIPDELKETLKSNGQEKYRVKVRNVFSSNSNHRTGLQNQKEIVSTKELRPNYNKRSTNTFIYHANPLYVITELLKENPDVEVDVDTSLGSDYVNAIVTQIRNQLPRDTNLRTTAINNANRTCELCGTTKTFLTNDGNQYFEGHHLIRLSPVIQARYKKSLDNVENIFCLCPTCHKKAHNADNETRESIVRTLLNKHPRIKEIYNINTEEDIQAIIDDYLPQN